MVTAKFKLISVTDFGSWRQVKLQPVYSSDPKSENYSWSQYTPSGEITLSISNPAAYNQFSEIGAEFLIDMWPTLQAVPATAAA